MLSNIIDRFFFKFWNPQKGLAVFAASLAVTGKVRPVLARPDSQFLVAVINQQTILIEKICQRLFLESFYPGLQGKFGIFTAYIDRIILDAASASDILIGTVLSDETVFAQKTLFTEDKDPCL